MSEAALQVWGGWTRESINRGPQVMSEVALQVWGRWTRESINPGPLAIAGVVDRHAEVNAIARGFIYPSIASPVATFAFA
jgi:hypothetical protein